MNDEYFKKAVTTGIVIVLIALTFLVLKPILLSIIMGIILAVVFAPIYEYTLKYVKKPNLNSAIICIALILIILIPLIFLTPIIIEQSFGIYVASQQISFEGVISNLLPSLSDDFSAELGGVLNKFITNSANSFVNSFSSLIFNLPNFLLQLIIVFSTFFFVLRDMAGFEKYVRSLLPFSKSIEDRLFKSSKDITFSVIYGQIIVGAIQGIIVGVGFFIFGVPNFLFLTILAILAGIFPIVGTTLIWLPVMIFLFIAGNDFQAVGVAAFGIVAAFIDNIVRPILVSKRARMHPLLILVGMIGGLFFFGILGFILGPLIIAYALIILEIYRGKELKGIFINPSQ
jgi:predicted PurR-regulated permease PerM